MTRNKHLSLLYFWAQLLETTDHESSVDHCKLTTNIFTVLNDQNSFHSAIDKPPGVSGGVKNPRRFSRYEFDSLEC